MGDEIRQIDTSSINRASIERAKRRKRRRRRQLILSMITMIIILAVIGAAIFFIGSKIKSGEGLDSLFKKFTSKPQQVETELITEAATETEAVVQTESETEAKQVTQADIDAVIAEADLQAQMYDYDGAIKVLKKSDFFGSNQELQDKVDDYTAMKEKCVAISPEDVTHIFYHSLVADPSKAFIPGEPGYDGWQQWMTTIKEFDAITESMYERGYVLVSIHDLIKKGKDENGVVTVEPQEIYLPEGKKPFVMSLDDLSYYHTYDDHGVASRLVLDADGKPTCEYIEDDGSIVYGDYDVVPRLDTFLEEHPDGCYRGARGIIALTGYNGVLGYRTDGTYDDAHNENEDVYYTDQDQEKWLDNHPDYDFETEVANAKAVADAMKAEGWEFASHTWGHKNIGETDYEDLVRDTERWLKYVTPIVGETDAIIFAHGADIAVGQYDDDDPKYSFLKDKGFDIYCNVDSVPYTTNVYPHYLHQGRRNLDGYRIYHDTLESDAITDDLFTATDVLDPDRPLPVPDLN